MKILFIGTDPQTVETVGLQLSQRWPEAKTVQKANVADSLELIEDTSIDVVVFYANFPEIESSTEAIRELRRISDIPLMVLSPQKGEHEVVTALHFGADYYVKLPCDPSELIARIWSLLRRADSVILPEEGNPVLRSSLVMNPAAKEVLIGNRSFKLTPSQFRLLNRLLIAPTDLDGGPEYETGLLKAPTGPLERYARHVAETDNRAIEGTESEQGVHQLFLDAPRYS